MPQTAALGVELTLNASVRLIEVKSNPDCSSRRLLDPCVARKLRSLLGALASTPKPITQRAGASEAHLAAHAVTLGIGASDL